METLQNNNFLLKIKNKGIYWRFECRLTSQECLIVSGVCVTGVGVTGSHHV
jgi:hypothetical protein